MEVSDVIPLDCLLGQTLSIQTTAHNCIIADFDDARFVVFMTLAAVP